MDMDTSALRSLAQTYFDAAYEMDAEKFASVFHPSSSVTKVAEDGNVGVTPIATWLAAVRDMQAPKQQGVERDDRILSIDVEGEPRALEGEIANSAALLHGPVVLLEGARDLEDRAESDDVESLMDSVTAEGEQPRVRSTTHRRGRT